MNSTSLSLLVQLQHPERPEAWPRFLDLYTPLFFYWAKQIGLNSSDAEDFVQDLLIHLLGKLPSFEHRGPGSFRGWLKTVTLNKCRERFRRRVLSPLDTDALVSLESRIENDTFWEQEYRQHLIARALTIMKSQLDSIIWQAGWQRIVEDRRASEVALNLNLSEATVHVYTGRVLRRLRADLQEMLD